MKVDGRKPTMQDIARRCARSVATVSRVLNGTSSSITISEATRKQILAAADELGFRPNPFARALRTLRSETLGVVVTESTNPFLASLVQAIEIAARSRGYHVLPLTATHDDPISTVETTRSAIAMLDALIVLGEPPHHWELVSESLARQRPVVYVARETRRRDVLAVYTDNEGGMELLLQHLYRLGHRRIECIAGPMTADMKARVATYQSFAKAHQGHYEIRHMSDDFRGGYEAARNLLANDPPPTAIVACDDVMAVGVLRAAHELGFRVPRDLSVVGFDGIALGEYTVPSLTTVLQPVPELSQAALDLTVQALDRGSSGKGNLRPVKVEPSLIVRGSSSPPPAKTPKKPETEAKTK